MKSLLGRPRHSQVADLTRIDSPEQQAGEQSHNHDNHIRQSPGRHGTCATVHAHRSRRRIVEHILGVGFVGLLVVLSLFSATSFLTLTAPVYRPVQSAHNQHRRFCAYSTRFRMESAWTSTGHVVQWESMTHIKPLKDLVEPGWAQALADVEPQIHLMGDFLRSEIAAGRKYLPASRNILRAFTIPFDDIKVLIVGQDPYPTPGHPVGLSFCVAPDVKPIPRSLANIYTELTDDLGVPMPANGDLTPWTKQGVMLLNRCLTVEPGKPGSHQGRGWEVVTDAAISALNNRRRPDGSVKPLVAILWGRKAQTLEPLLTNAFIIKSPHPSPMSARYGFFGSKPFSRANQALIEAGEQPVDWTLPSA